MKILKDEILRLFASKYLGFTDKDFEFNDEDEEKNFYNIIQFFILGIEKEREFLRYSISGGKEYGYFEHDVESVKKMLNERTVSILDEKNISMKEGEFCVLEEEEK